MNRVVITGLGIYSCIGKNLQEVKNSLYEGKSGIIYDPVRKDFGYRSALTGWVERPALKGLLDRRSRIMLAEEGEYAYMATLEALQQAGISEAYIAEIEPGILYGNDSSAKAVIESTDLIREKKDTMLVGSAAVFQTLNSTVTMNLATIFKLKGINLTVSCLCQWFSLHRAGLFINKNGIAAMRYCRRCSEINHLSMGTFDALGAFSIRR